MKKKKPRTGITRRQLRSSTFVLALTSCFFLLSLHAASETRKPKTKETAVIFGTVWGPDDRALPGIRVNIRKAGEKKTRWQVYSSRRGEFEQEVPSGKQDYVIRADVKGVKLPGGRHLQPSPEVTVHIEGNERADTGLHLK
jgi:hypothetical protein